MKICRSKTVRVRPIPKEKGMDYDVDAWENAVVATMCAWIERHYAPGDGVEFLWRARFKEDLVTKFVRDEPWISLANRVYLRDLLVHAFEALGYRCVLANTSYSKKRVRFPDGSCHRVTGVVVDIQEK